MKKSKFDCANVSDEKLTEKKNQPTRSQDDTLLPDKVSSPSKANALSIEPSSVSPIKAVTPSTKNESQTQTQQERTENQKNESTDVFLQTAPKFSDLNEASPKRGRPRLARADFDVNEALKIKESLLTRHPCHDQSGLAEEYETFCANYTPTPNWPKSPTVDLFVCGAMANGMMRSSALEAYSYLSKMFPAKTPVDRNERYAFKFALKASRALEDGRQLTLLGLDELRPYIDEMEDDVEKKTFLYLLLATGARPSCIFNVDMHLWTIETTGRNKQPTALTVNWRLRKAQQDRDKRHNASFDFAWSMAIPDSVSKFLNEKTHKDWLHLCQKPDQIASVVNGWLKKLHPRLLADKLITHAEPPTSSAFRLRMDHRLRELGKNDDEIKALLDHSLSMSEAHYAGQIKK